MGLVTTNALWVGGVALVLFTATVGTVTSRNRPVGALLLVVLTGLLVRLPFAVYVPVHDDSPVYYGVAKQLAQGTFVVSGHIGVEAIMAVFVVFFGRSGANIASLTASLITIPVVGAIAARLFSSRVAGLGAAAALAVAPLHIYYSSWAYTEPIAICLFCATVYLIISDRYLWGAVFTLGMSLVRIEYALLILCPLMVLRLSRWEFVRKAVVFGPLVGVSALTLALRSIPPDEVEQSLLFSTLNTPVYSVSFLLKLSRDPIAALSTNAQFYAVHFLHWGVPYWELALVNPVLPVLFLLGVYTLLPKFRASGLSVAIVLLSITATFLVREFVAPSGVLILALLSLAAVSHILLYPRSAPEFQPLLALIPYLMLLLVFYRSPRYLLPLVVVGCLFAGRGAAIAYSKLAVGDPWEIRFRSPI